MQMIYNTISEYLAAKRRYEEVLARIEGGEMSMNVKGAWISKEEYDRHNSRPRYEPAANEQLDGTQIQTGVITKHSRG